MKTLNTITASTAFGHVLLCCTYANALTLAKIPQGDCKRGLYWRFVGKDRILFGYLELFITDHRSRWRTTKNENAFSSRRCCAKKRNIAGKFCCKHQLEATARRSSAFVREIQHGRFDPRQRNDIFLAKGDLFFPVAGCDRAILFPHLGLGETWVQLGCNYSERTNNRQNDAEPTSTGQ